MIVYQNDRDMLYDMNQNFSNNPHFKTEDSRKTLICPCNLFYHQVHIKIRKKFVYRHTTLWKVP